MAGTSDANSNFHSSVISFLVVRFFTKRHLVFRKIYHNYTKFGGICQAKQPENDKNVKNSTKGMERGLNTALPHAGNSDLRLSAVLE